MLWVAVGKVWNLCFVTEQSNSSPFCCFHSLISKVVCIFAPPMLIKSNEIRNSLKDAWPQKLISEAKVFWVDSSVRGYTVAEVHDNNQIFPEFILYYKRFQWHGGLRLGLQPGKIRIKHWWIWLMPGFFRKENHFLKGFPIEISKVLQSLWLYDASNWHHYIFLLQRTLRVGDIKCLWDL